MNYIARAYPVPLPNQMENFQGWLNKVAASGYELVSISPSTIATHQIFVWRGAGGREMRAEGGGDAFPWSADYSSTEE